MKIKSICVLFILLIITINGLLAQQVVVSWKEVFSSYIEIEKYDKRIKAHNLCVESLVMTDLFYKRYINDDVYMNGSVSIGYLNKEALLMTNSIKNMRPVKGSVDKYYIGVKDSKLLIRKDIEDEWSPLNIKLTKELSNPNKKKNDDSPWDKIWILQIQCQYFEGEYVLKVDSHDFPVQD